MKKRSVSLALIAKDEAHNLPALLKSVEGCFDEIHLTDTGSQDGTPDIAEKLGCKVHHFKWVDDFAAARNASFEPIKTEFVAWLDLDDVLEDKAAFIRFRDEVMDLADYWVANYIYASHDNGNPACTFMRERVFRVSKGLRWRYFVHEGVPAVSTGGPIKTQFCPTWRVRHKRTPQDLLQDRSRNLGLFEKNTAKMDTRMRYYYGKELFEAAKPVEAIGQLMGALSEKDLELHDRILGYQYAMLSYAQCNQFERAIDVAHSGLQLAPQRAEFWTGIGDAYLKLGRLGEAIPYFQAAKHCGLPGLGQASPIFHYEDVYRHYPRNQLSRIYFQMQNIDLAKKEAEDSRQSFPDHPESKLILDELTRITTSVISLEGAKSCDDIWITCPPNAPYLWDADIAKIRAMGGSETACIEMARHLHRLSGRAVKVFNVRESRQMCDGVEYLPNKDVVAAAAREKPWLHIAWRHTIPITKAPTFIWAHDLITPGLENEANYVKVMTLTPFHSNFMQSMQGVKPSKIYQTRNGIIASRFDPSGPWPAKDLTKVVFPSSPDRGLDRAMRIMDRVREVHPELKLHVYYGIEHLPQWGHAALHDRLVEMMKERPWVIYHGATQQDKLVEELKAAVIWLHPADFIETSCITAKEMLASGVYPVTRRLGGLRDTLAGAERDGMATLLDSDCVTEGEYQLYIDATLEAIQHRKWERVQIDAKAHSWEHVAEEWLRDLPGLAGYAEVGLHATA